MSSKSDYDFDFKGEKIDRLLPFILSFLMYCAIIAIVSCGFTYNLTQRWSNNLNGHMTIEIQSSTVGISDTLTPQQKNDVLDTIQKTPGIKFVRQLKEEDILKVLEPWLRGTAIPDDFPFPVIFDAIADKNVKVDLLDLTERLSKITPDVKIYDHANWYDPILKISNGLFFFAILLSCFIFATVCATVIFITKKTLREHSDIVRILQLIGAPNNYIASQFRRYYFSVGGLASVIAFVSGVLSILAINFVANVEPWNITSLKYLGFVLAIPMVLTIVIIITSQRTVLFFLNKEQWIN